MKSPARGAATSIHLASAPGLGQVTGRYFAGGKPRKSAGRSYDQAAAARLWQASADLAGLTATRVTAAGSHSPADHAGRHDLDARHGLPGLAAGR
jgi:retinol dehydrogenase 14